MVKGLDPIFAQGSAHGRSAIAVVRITGNLPSSLFHELDIKKTNARFLLETLILGLLPTSVLS